MRDEPITRREALRITATVGAASAFGGGLSLAILREAGLRRVRETRVRMGTVVTLTVVHEDDDAARALVRSSFDEIDRLESIFSRYRPDTPVGRLNANGSIAKPPTELLDVLAHARAVSLASGGAFDVTVAPVLDLYVRSFESTGGPPGDLDVSVALERVDHRRLSFDEDEVRLGAPDMAITLDGIAKGFVVDRTVDALVAGGADRVLVDAGGDMSSSGPSSESEPWTVGVQDPLDEEGLVGVVRLSGNAVATSGDYMRSFTDDRRYNHIIDPRTGRSPGETSSVSVVAATAMESDVLSTAVFVLGPEEGAALLERTPGAEGLIVTKTGERFYSSGMQRRAA